MQNFAFAFRPLFVGLEAALISKLLDFGFQKFRNQSNREASKVAAPLQSLSRAHRSQYWLRCARASLQKNL